MVNTEQTGVERRSIAILLVAQVAMASGALFGRQALAASTPLFVATARMLAVSLPFALRHILRRRPRLAVADELRLAGAGALLAAQFLLWTAALVRLSVGSTTLLVCLTPLWVGLFDALVRRRQVPRLFWYGMLLAVTGVAAMVFGPTGADAEVGGRAAGTACALGCSLASSGYLLTVRRVAKGGPGSIDMLDVVCRTYGSAACLLLLACLATGTRAPAARDAAVWGSIAGMALVTQGLGHTLQNISLQRLRPRIVGLATLLEPLIAAALAAAIFGETLRPASLLGGLVVLLGLGIGLQAERTN